MLSSKVANDVITMWPTIAILEAAKNASHERGRIRQAALDKNPSLPSSKNLPHLRRRPPPHLRRTPPPSWIFTPEDGRAPSHLRSSALKNEVLPPKRSCGSTGTSPWPSSGSAARRRRSKQTKQTNIYIYIYIRCVLYY